MDGPSDHTKTLFPSPPSSIRASTSERIGTRVIRESVKGDELLASLRGWARARLYRGDGVGTTRRREQRRMTARMPPFLAVLVELRCWRVFARGVGRLGEGYGRKGGGGQKVVGADV